MIRSRTGTIAHEIGKRSLLGGAPPNEFQQPQFKTQMRFPKLAIVDLFNVLPRFRLPAVRLPAGPQMPVIQTGHLRR